eukprot:739432-Amphidinium_carterae.1
MNKSTYVTSSASPAIAAPSSGIIAVLAGRSVDPLASATPARLVFPGQHVSVQLVHNIRSLRILQVCLQIQEVGQLIPVVLYMHLLQYEATTE